MNVKKDPIKNSATQFKWRGYGMGKYRNHATTNRMKSRKSRVNLFHRTQQRCWRWRRRRRSPRHKFRGVSFIVEETDCVIDLSQGYCTCAKTYQHQQSSSSSDGIAATKATKSWTTTQHNTTAHNKQYNVTDWLSCRQHFTNKSS